MPHPASQLLLVTVRRGKFTHLLSTKDAAFLQELQPGGFVLWGSDPGKEEQLRELTDQLRDLCEIEPFICIGGGQGLYPPTAFGVHHGIEIRSFLRKDSGEFLLRFGSITGRLMRIQGFNFNLAPLRDIYDLGRNEQEIASACDFIRSMRMQGVLGCGRLSLGGFGARSLTGGKSAITLSLESLLRFHLTPFASLMPEFDGMAIYGAAPPGIDTELPAPMYDDIITRLLREQFGYDRLLLTAPLDVRSAVEAGADLVLLSREASSAREALSALEDLPDSTLSAAIERIERAKRRLHKPVNFTSEAFAEVDADLEELYDEAIFQKDKNNDNNR